MRSARQIVRQRLKVLPGEVSAYSIEQCIQLVRLALLLDPRSAKLNYYLAYFYAVAGKSSHALLYVKRSLKLGFRSLKLITHSVAFLKVRQLKGFGDVMEKYLKGAKNHT